MDYVPTVLWTIICTRGLYRWRKNAREMSENLIALRSNGNHNEEAILFAKSDKLMDTLRACVFLNGIILGLVAFPLTAGWSWAMTPMFLRVFSNYFQWTLIGSFAIFALNGEIYGYVLDKVRGRRS